MADLQALQVFAATHGFGLTNPLTHAQVVTLARYWLPKIRFYEDERFHPIRLDEVVAEVERLFAELPPVAQDQWRVTKFVRTGPASGENRAFAPPVVHVPDGMVPQGNFALAAVRVLNDGTPARDALSVPEVGTSTMITHGASFTRSNHFFGAVATKAGSNTASPGDPFLPRSDEPNPSPPPARRPRMTVMASWLNLLELLEYELVVAEAGDAYPPDGLRRAFNIAGLLLRPKLPNAPPLTPKEQREYLLSAIAAHKAGNPLPDPPPGWRLDRTAWNAVTRFAFLEYDFFYAYNDFERYQTAIFDNEHEGDNEGCCLVFDRSVTNLAAAGGDEALRRAVPHAVITSVHEEYQNADLIRFIPPPITDPSNPAPPARDVVDFTVYVAGGSHATYLTPGIHDLVDFGDYWGWVEENAPYLLVGAPIILVVAIILSMIEHFVDTEDFTSEDGVHGGPDDLIEGDPTAVKTYVQVMPMSADNHIYQPAHEDLLRLRAYAGKWGANDGIVDKSPAFVPKTARYFRKLVENL